MGGARSPVGVVWNVLLRSFCSNKEVAEWNCLILTKEMEVVESDDDDDKEK